MCKYKPVEWSCGCYYGAWEYCDNVKTPNKDNAPCRTEVSLNSRRYEPEKVQHAHCCSALCCRRRIRQAHDRVWNAEEIAGVNHDGKFCDWTDVHISGISLAKKKEMTDEIIQARKEMENEIKLHDETCRTALRAGPAYTEGMRIKFGFFLMNKYSYQQKLSQLLPRLATQKSVSSQKLREYLDDHEKQWPIF